MKTHPELESTLIHFLCRVELTRCVGGNLPPGTDPMGFHLGPPTSRVPPLILDFVKDFPRAHEIFRPPTTEEIERELNIRPRPLPPGCANEGRWPGDVVPWFHPK
jgi:hypothetical protein